MIKVKMMMFTDPGDVVELVTTWNESVLQVKLAPCLERSFELLLELGDVGGEVDVVELDPLQTDRPVYVSQPPGDPGKTSRLTSNGWCVRLHYGTIKTINKTICRKLSREARQIGQWHVKRVECVEDT